MQNRVRVVAAVFAVAALGLSGCGAQDARPAPEPTLTKPALPSTPTPAPSPPAEPEFDRNAHSIDDAASIWVVSNKHRPLHPIDYAPADLDMPDGVENEFTQPLRAPAARAVERLVAAAAADGHFLMITSAYRDYGTQVSLYGNYVARDGQLAADTYSARPGFSEHQTGLAVDLDDRSGCYLQACFGETAAGRWLADHAAEFGFLVRYPNGKEHITGFTYEPWHFRYVGEELALELRDSGMVTLEEFFGLDAAPGYLD